MISMVMQVVELEW